MAGIYLCMMIILEQTEVSAADIEVVGTIFDTRCLTTQGFVHVLQVANASCQLIVEHLLVGDAIREFTSWYFSCETRGSSPLEDTAPSWVAKCGCFFRRSFAKRYAILGCNEVLTADKLHGHEGEYSGYCQQDSMQGIHLYMRDEQNFMK